MALARGIVKLMPYDEGWHEEYTKEKELLESLLKDYLLEIHHVGSTSVKGLWAKPIIDILVVIKDLKDIPKIEEILNPYNYENRGQRGIPDRFFFAKGPEEARSHYLHVTLKGSDTYFDQLYFKRYLEEHPEYITKYNNLKMKLAEMYANERPKYTAAKDEFIKEVISLGKKEYQD